MPRRIRLPKRYTVIVTRPGGRALSVSFTLLVPVVLLALLLFWGAVSFKLAREAREASRLREEVRVLAGQVRRLSTDLLAEQNKNRALASRASEMLGRLDALEAELDALRKRAGLSKAALEKKAPSPGPVGAGRPASTEELFAALDAHLQSFQDRLEGVVAPALEATLKREAATPQGWPLRVKTYIASGFGVRKNPFGRGYEFHNGLDLPAWYGTKIYATAPGRVVEAGWSNIFGRYVKIDHGYGYQTLYGHMQKIAVKRGSWVKRGQVIGYVGSTGRSTGPHVHYSVFVKGRSVDPRPFLKTPVYAAR